ncbi:MAG: peroxiredoxin [Byssovorax sp.]
MLKVGERAPAIDAMTSSGTRFVLAEQIGLCTVVYFFPRSFTPGCTTETKSFRDNHVELEFAGVSVVGISTDDLTTQCNFARSIKTPFPMIGDKDSAISRAYDVLWPLIGVAKRVTYVINDQQMIEAVFRHEIDVKSHRDDVLRFVNEKFLGLREPPR